MHGTGPQSWTPHSLSKVWCRWQGFQTTLGLYVHHCFQDEEWAYTLQCVHTLLQTLTTSAALLAWQQPWMQAPSASSPLTEGASQGCLERAPSARKEVRPRTSSWSLPSRHTFSQWCQPQWWGNQTWCWQQASSSRWCGVHRLRWSVWAGHRWWGALSADKNFDGRLYTGRISAGLCQQPLQVLHGKRGQWNACF